MSNINIKQILSWLLFVLVLVGLGYFVYITVVKNNGKVKEEIKLSPSDTINFLEAKNKTKLPFVVETSDLSFDKLPIRVKILILDNSKNVVIKSPTFSDSSTGFLVTYEYSGKVLDAYRLLRIATSKDYDFVEGRMTDEAGLMVLEDSRYTSKISIVVSDVNTVKVGIIVNIK